MEQDASEGIQSVPENANKVYLFNGPPIFSMFKSYMCSFGFEHDDRKPHELSWFWGLSTFVSCGALCVALCIEWQICTWHWCSLQNKQNITYFLTQVHYIKIRIWFSNQRFLFYRAFKNTRPCQQIMFYQAFKNTRLCQSLALKSVCFLLSFCKIYGCFTFWF